MGDIWDGLPGAPVFEFGTYLNPGHYDVLIDKVFTKTTQKSGDGFISEMQILTAQKRVEPEYAAIDPSPVGTSGTFYLKMQNQNTFLPNLKQFYCGIFGIDVNSPDGQQFNQYLSAFARRVVSAENLLGGLRAHVGTRYKIIQSGPNRGNNFTAHDWAPYVLDLNDGYKTPDWKELLARPVPAFAQVPQQAAWPAYQAPPPVPPPNGAWAPPGAPAWNPPAGAVQRPPPPPAPPVNPTAGWQRANGYRLNPATNAWELDT
jgi:hypothetical protein